MDVYECVRSRLSVREFKPDPVPESLVTRTLQAGRWAPSSDNHQPWHFIVIKDRETLKEAVRVGQIKPFVADAPMAIAIVMDNYDRPLLDAGRALQQMQLMAWSQGVGSCFVGVPPENVQVLKRLLGVPDDLELITVMPFGFPADGVEGRGKRRKPLSEIAHSERFGQPYPAG